MAKVNSEKEESVLGDVVISPKKKQVHIVKIKPVQVTGGVIRTKLNDGKTTRLMNGAQVRLASHTNEYGGYSEFISEEDFIKHVLPHNPSNTYRGYLKDYHVVLTNDGINLDISVPEHFIKYQFLKGHPKVSPSRALANPSVHFFYVEDEVAEAEVHSKYFDAKIAAYDILKDLSSDKKLMLMRLFGRNYDSQSPAVVNKHLIEIVDSDPIKFVSIYNDPNRDFKILLEMLVQKRIITRSGLSYYYEDLALGGNIEQTIEFLKKVENAQLVQTFKKLMLG
jgi:hypothetical protein